VAEDDGFVSRWSRRKAQVQRAAAVPTEPVAPISPIVSITPVPPSEPAPGTAPAAEAPPLAPAPTQPAAPAPTLDDVAALNKESDYSRFVARDVDPGVRNAAMKKLFASDPHFNTMDGLDVYIDDYNKFEPVPRSILRQLVNARSLGLIDDELEEQPRPDNPQADEDADLQLQPNDAAGPRGPEPGVADGGPADPALPDAVPPRGA
jgi:hypothetical protein